MRLINLITFLILVSCHNQGGEVANSISGEIKDGKFSNDYLTMDILENWIEWSKSDSTQFLTIAKPKEVFSPNIILLALDKNGYVSAEDYLKSLTEHYSTKPEYQLVSQMNSQKIDSRTFYFSEFTFTKDGKKIKQVYGATNMEEYFLGFVTTDNSENIEPEIWTTLESIRFKEVSKKHVQRASRQQKLSVSAG